MITNGLGGNGLNLAPNENGERNTPDREKAFFDKEKELKIEKDTRKRKRELRRLLAKLASQGIISRQRSEEITKILKDYNNPADILQKLKSELNNSEQTVSGAANMADLASKILERSRLKNEKKNDEQQARGEDDKEILAKYKQELADETQSADIPERNESTVTEEVLMPAVKELAKLPLRKINERLFELEQELGDIKTKTRETGENDEINHLQAEIYIYRAARYQRTRDNLVQVRKIRGVLARQSTRTNEQTESSLKIEQELNSIQTDQPDDIDAFETRIEEIRLLSQRYVEQTPSDGENEIVRKGETEETTLDRTTKINDYRNLKEIQAILPQGELASDIDIIENGKLDQKEYAQRLKLFKGRFEGIITSLEGQVDEYTSSAELVGTGSILSKLKELKSVAEQASVDGGEEDYYMIITTATPLLVSAEALVKLRSVSEIDSKEQYIKGFKKRLAMLPNQRQEKILKLIQSNQSTGEQSGSEVELENLTAEQLGSLIERMAGSYAQATLDTTTSEKRSELDRALELSELQYDSLISQSDPKLLTNDLRVQFVNDVLDRWGASMDETESERSKWDILPLSHMRNLLDGYGFNSLVDIYHSEEDSSKKEKISNIITSRVTALIGEGSNSNNVEDEISEAVTKLLEGDSLGLIRWYQEKVTEQTDPNTKLLLERIKDAVEIVSMQPMSLDMSADTTDANGNILIATDESANPLMKKIFVLRTMDKRLTSVFEKLNVVNRNLVDSVDDESKEDNRTSSHGQLEMLAYRDIVLNRALMFAGGSEKIKIRRALESVNLIPSDGESVSDYQSRVTEEIATALNRLSLNTAENEPQGEDGTDDADPTGRRALTDEIIELSNALDSTNSDIRSAFIVEKVPGGLAVRVRDQENFRKLLGINGNELTENEMFEFHGAALKNSLLSQGLQKLSNIDFSGGTEPHIIVLNSESSEVQDYHEIGHLLDRSLSRQMDVVERNSDIQTGINELTARLLTPEYALDTGEDKIIQSNEEFGLSKLGSKNYIPNLFDLGILPRESMSEGAEQDDEDSRELAEKKKLLEVTRLVDRILKNIDPSKRETAEFEYTKKLLLGKIYHYGEDLDGLLDDLKISYATELGINQSGDGSASNADDMTNDNDSINPDEMYFGSPERKKNLAESGSLNSLRKVQNVYDFAMNYGGVQQQRGGLLGAVPGFRTVRSGPLGIAGAPVVSGSRPKGAGIPDPLGWDRLLRMQGGKEQAWYGVGERKSKEFNWKDTTINRKKAWSYFGEKEPMAFVPFVKNIPVAGSIINGLAGAGLRFIAPFNTRDIASGISNTPIGDLFGVSRYRGANPVKFAGQFSRQAEEYVKTDLPGWVERHRSQGLEDYTPDFISQLRLNENHFAAITGMQQKLNTAVDQNEVLSFLESHKLISLEVRDGRPAYSQDISEKKSETISSYDFKKMQQEVFDYNSAEASRFTKRTGTYMMRGEAYVPHVDGTSIFFLSKKDSDDVKAGRKRIENVRAIPIHEDTFIKKFGMAAMRTEGAGFYAAWRPQEVRFDGKLYYVHYDPTGMPGLYEEKFIDWENSPRKPLMKNGRRVEPRYAVPFRKVGSDRRIMEVDVASNNLFQEFMKVRNRQAEIYKKKHGNNKEIPESELYSLRDLIRSIKAYEDPYASVVEDPPFVHMKEVNGIRYMSLRIPDPSGNGKHIEMDYEVAKELINKIEKYYTHDKISRQTIVKNLNPEQIYQENQIPSSERIRSMVQRYIALVLADRLVNTDANNTGAVSDNEFNLIKNHDIRSNLKDLEDILFKDYRSLYFVNNFNADEYRQKIARQYGGSIAEMSKNPKNFINADPYSIAGIATLREKLSEKGANSNDAIALEEQIYARLIDQNVQNAALTTAQGQFAVSTTTRIINNLMLGNTGNFIDPSPTSKTGNNPVPITHLFDDFMQNTVTALNSTDNFAKHLNSEYDRRTVTRFLGKMADETERDRLSMDTISGVNDLLKYRKQMKDYVIRMMNMSDYLNADFKRYQLGKSLFETWSKIARRGNTLAFFASIGVMAAFGSPIAFAALVGSVGFARYFNPLLDRFTDRNAQRRNQMRELARKARQDAIRLKQEFDKGGTLDENTMIDLDDLLLEYNIMAEGIQALDTPDSWAPKQPPLMKFALDQVLGEQGVITKAINS